MPFSSITDKDQLRSLKIAVSSRLSGSSKRHGSSRHSDGPSEPSSPTGSECSTLVDFAVDRNVNLGDLTHYALQETEDDTRDTSLLEPENSAWAHGKRYGILPLKKAQHRRRSSTASESTHHVRKLYDDTDSPDAEMIDEEDRAWTMVSKNGMLPKRHHKSARWQKVTTGSRSGLEAQLLDPEDRAWM